MSRHSTQSKRLLIFCGMAMILSACSQGGARVVTTPTVTAFAPSRQTLAAKSSDDFKQGREDYQAIALSKLGRGEKLTGSDPKAIALRVFRNTEPERGKSAITVKTDYPKAVAIVTQIGIADDSVRSIRYRVEFLATANTVPADQVWSLVWAGSQFKCQPGRGHQDWSTELCK
jgi:hypothetical protein